MTAPSGAPDRCRGGGSYRLSLKHLLVAIPLLFTSPLPGQDTLQVLLLPIESARTLYARFLPLKQYLEHSTGRVVQLSIPRNMEEIDQKFERGMVDVAFLCPVLYCRLRARFPVTPLVTFRQKGETTTTSVVVVREDSPVQRLADLKEHTFAYGKHQCAASGLVPMAMFQAAGFLPRDFLEVGRLGSDESALYAVLARLYDATAVSRRVARPYLHRGLRIIRESFPIPNNLIAIHAHLSPKMRFRLRQAFLALDTLQHRQILKHLGEDIDGFVPVQDRDYQTIRLLLRSVHGEENDPPEAASGLRVGLPPFFSRVALFLQFEPLLQQWQRQAGQRLLPIICDSPDAYLTRLRNEEFDIAVLSPPLWKALRDSPYQKQLTLPGSRPPFAPRQGIWIARKESSIRQLEQILHQRVAVVSPWSQSGYLSQRNLLQKQGIGWHPLQVVTAGTHERVLLLVYTGEVEAGAVSAGALDLLKNDLDTARIRILARNQKMDPWFVVVHPRTGIRLRAQTRGGGQLLFGAFVNPADLLWHLLTPTGFPDQKALLPKLTSTNVTGQGF